MWGIRAVRVAWLAAVILAAVGGGGCRHCGNKPATPALDTAEPQFHSPGHGPHEGSNAEPPQHVDPERIHGGII